MCFPTATHQHTRIEYIDRENLRNCYFVVAAAVAAVAAVLLNPLLGINQLFEDCLGQCRYLGGDGAGEPEFRNVFLIVLHIQRCS